ncbi:MAG: ABC transporter permease [Atopobiaceae bacterium]|nr:ABC transporter permease [Atopobiaceae bacterium]
MRGLPYEKRRIVVPLLTLVVFIAAWELLVRMGVVPSFLLPAPSAVATAFVADAPLLVEHTLTTVLEAALGLAIGVVVGFVFAVLMDRFETFYLAFNPLITVSQTIPTVAIAPLLVLWFGYGLAPKILLIVLTTFFPVTVSLVSGFRSVDPDVIDLMRTMNATDRQIFMRAKLPMALDQFFSGLRISATYAIVGAVIAEWLGGFSGLGVYMTRVRKSFSYDSMFAVIILISALSLGLMKGIDLLAKVCMPWKQGARDK